MFSKILLSHLSIAGLFLSVGTAAFADDLPDGNTLLKDFTKAKFQVGGTLRYSISNSLFGEYVYESEGTSWAAALDAGYESRDAIVDCLAQSPECEVFGTGLFGADGDRLFVRIVSIDSIVPVPLDTEVAANLIAACWNVGSLSVDALNEAASVFFRISFPNFRPENLTSQRTMNSAQRQVFESGRRAISRCGARGLPLPVGNYEMRFSVPNYQIIRHFN